MALLPDVAMSVIAVAVLEVLLRCRYPLPRLAGRLGVTLASRADAEAPSRPVVRLSGRDWRRYCATQVLFDRWPAQGTCLRRSLVTGWRLRHLGPVLHLGVRRTASGVVEAHAWLSIGGVVWDPTAVLYTRFGVDDTSSRPPVRDEG